MESSFGKHTLLKVHNDFGPMNKINNFLKRIFLTNQLSETNLSDINFLKRIFQVCNPITTAKNHLISDRNHANNIKPLAEQPLNSSTLGKVAMSTAQQIGRLKHIQ